MWRILNTFVPWVKLEVFCKNHASKRLIPFLYYSCCPALAAFIFQAIGPGLAFPLLFLSVGCPLQAGDVGSTWWRPDVSPPPGWAEAGGQVQRQRYEKRRRKASGSFHPLPFRERSKQAYCSLILEDGLSDFFSNKLEISLHPHRNLSHHVPRGPQAWPEVGKPDILPLPQDSCSLLLSSPPHPGEAVFTPTAGAKDWGGMGTNQRWWFD